MVTYNYVKQVTKIVAFNDYIFRLFPIPAVINAVGDNISISFSEQLSTENLTLLNTLVTDYTDPAEFLVLDHTETLSGVSGKTNLTTPFDVQSLIFPGKNSGNGSVIDSIKFILKLSTLDVGVASGITGQVNIEIYDQTRDITLVSLNVNVDEIFTDWTTRAGNGETGMRCNYKSVQISDLHGSIPDHDCIWIYRVTVPNTLVYARLDSLQRLYYIIE